ncbi:MAG: DNA-binding response regulator [Crocinitomicaceae bacterium]|nr:DNA-binding response regulator [Crocinitomicaceae bacterium]|tara:strand:- start:237 stop:992 length:756 start_codon:yes stop_codon:yes gene_type:complete
MKALIIEDEIPASKRLQSLLNELDTTIEIVDVVDSIEDAVLWFESMEIPDVIFMDIQLADGMSFEIFEKVDISSPVIFITAFDHYAIKAIKHNGVDYLLKPIDKGELESAIHRVKRKPSSTIGDIKSLIKTIQSDSKQTYKERFLVKVGDQLKYVPTAKVAFFYVEDGYCHLCTFNEKTLVLDYSLDQLNELLDPNEFFRISRKLIINHQAIDKIHSWYNGRLKLELLPKPGFDTMVSRERVKEFKAWLEN